ncbi:MAG: KamA family radical SAM protein, partial [Anaerotignaceae bacterium]
ISNEQVLKLDAILEQYPMSVNRYYLSLIDFNNPNDPILKLCIPSASEINLDGNADTSGEADNTIITGLQHKYEQTAIILSSNLCAMYCRHCFRKRMVGLSNDEVASHMKEIIEYVNDHKEIRNVLISGGDSFVNSNENIEKYLDAFSKMEHLDFIRFGTRIPVVMPHRIYEDQELLNILEKYNKLKQIVVITHFNHINEITPQSIQSINALKNIGIPIRNQAVLLKGINDDVDVLSSLMNKLTNIGVQPYYVFQCRPVKGVKNQFQVPLLKGYDIVEGAKAKMNGLAKSFRYVLSNPKGKLELLGKAEKNKLIVKYHEAKDTSMYGKAFIQEVEDNTCWID